MLSKYSAESQPINGKVAQPKSENKTKVREKMVEIQQIKYGRINS